MLRGDGLLSRFVCSVFVFSLAAMLVAACSDSPSFEASGRATTDGEGEPRAGLSVRGKDAVISVASAGRENSGCLMRSVSGGGGHLEVSTEGGSKVVLWSEAQVGGLFVIDEDGQKRCWLGLRDKKTELVLRDGEGAEQFHAPKSEDD